MTTPFCYTRYNKPFTQYLADEESSSGEESPVPCKRPRTDTLGASSTTSISSVVAESDDEPPELPIPSNGHSLFGSAKNVAISSKGAGAGENIRLSRSSWSENCSSSNEQDDDVQHGTDNPDNDSEDDAGRPQFRAFTENRSNSDQGNSDGGDGGENVEGRYSNISKRLMGKMGYKLGKGLGKFEHGRTQPVEASAQKGRRGLGMKPSIVGAIPQDFKWSPDDSTPEVKEEIIWIPASKDTLSGDILEDWLKRGPKKLTIADETEFVDPTILKGVLNAKTIFDSLDDEDLRNARFRSNPYETIGSVIFLNRAAVKMANIDAIFDFMFTKPKTADGKSVLDSTDLLYFADVCAGPGGFSEYVLFRQKWRAKGFGFTLKGKCDFKLSDFYAGTPETFNPYYGVEDDGNVFNPANLSALKDNVLAQTEDKGVHFLMADGGFSVEGQENIQEILSKQLYLCQCLAALMLVRTGGHFVVKLFDVFTPFSVGLLYIMYHSFEHVCIVKPVTSRPANSERYLVCKWKRRDTDATEKHLFSVNAILWSEREGLDVSELVPLHVMQNDKEFYEYIYRSNCVIGEKQIKNLLKIAEFSKDKKLKDETQDQMKKHCLEVWQLPDQVRKAAPRLQPDDCLNAILDGIRSRPPEAQSPQSFKGNVLSAAPEYLASPDQLGVFKSVYDWHFMFLNSGKNSPDLKFFIGCGGRQVYQLDGTRWNLAAELHVTMPAKTLIYAEIVKEYRGQIYNKALHVIDAMMLGGIDVSHLSLTERRSECARFCSALHRPFEAGAVPLRCKRLLGLERFPGAVADLECRAMKKIRRAVTCAVPSRGHTDNAFHIVGGVLFIKEIKEPWIAQMSKKHHTKYYFGIGKDKKPRSEFHIPEAARLNMIQAFTSRLQWPWEPASAVLEGLPHEGLKRVELENYINDYINR